MTESMKVLRKKTAWRSREAVGMDVLKCFGVTFSQITARESEGGALRFWSGTERRLSSRDRGIKVDGMLCTGYRCAQR